MIVRLSDRPRRVIRNRIDGRLAEAWDANIVKVSGYRYEVELPAIAWHQIHEILQGHAIGPRGGYSTEARAVSLVSALTAVSRAVNARLYHPAMFRRGLVGHITATIPAWTVGDITPGERMFSPYPRPGCQFRVLRPVHRVERGLRLTVWRPGSPDPERVLEQESYHLVFGVEVRV